MPVAMFLASIGMAVSAQIPADRMPAQPQPNEVFIADFQVFLAEARERYAQDPSIDNMEAMIRYLNEVVKDTSRGEVMSNLAQAAILTDDASEASSGERQLMALALRELQTSTEEIFLLVAPYWPPIEDVVNKDALIDLMSPHHVHLDLAVQTLRDAWAEGDHQYDGLVDLFYGSHAYSAWIVMHRLEGADEGEWDELSDRLRKVLHPYNDYYRTRPDELPPGTREGLHELLVEYSQDDSLWARVFAAEILNKVPYMRDPEIEAALLADPHWLIQRRLAYLHEDEPAPGEE